MEEFLKTAQIKVADLLKVFSNDLAAASKDKCSEISRLLGYWILKTYPDAKISIWKGSLGDDLQHDVISATYLDKTYIIDPTIWQLFPESESILIGQSDPKATPTFLNSKYGGGWHRSEEIKEWNVHKEEELLKIINTF